MENGSLQGYEGPRIPREEERTALVELSCSIFFGEGSDYEQLARAWPMALHSDMREHTLAMFHEGQPVSLITRLERDFLVHGHRLRMGYVGSVCTHAGHRGKGLASTILAATMRQFEEADVDFVHISGTRPLYYGAGADHVAAEIRFKLGHDFVVPDAPMVQLRHATAEDIDTLVTLARREDVRFIRPRTDFELIMTYRHCAGRSCRFELIEQAGIPVGYLLINPQEDGRFQVLEFAGERLCIRAALAHRLAQSEDGVALEVNAPHGDLLIDLLRASGAHGEPAKTGGTVKVLNFDRTMRKLLPYFRERLGGRFDLHLAAGKERYLAWNDEGMLQLEGERTLLWTLLGTPPDGCVEDPHATGILHTLVAECLPLPLPSFYLNMI